MKFSIRDLLWLTLLAAFAVAWWTDRSRLAAEVERLTSWEEWQSVPPVVDPSGTTPNGDTDDP